MSVIVFQFIPVFNDVKKLIVSLNRSTTERRDQVVIVMLDHLHKFQIIDELAQLNAKIVKELDYVSMYGIVLRNMSEKVEYCMREISESLRFDAFVYMNEQRNNKPVSTSNCSIP